MSYKNIPEEELKNKIAKDIFWQFDCTKIIGKVDFCVKPITTKPRSTNNNDKHTSTSLSELKTSSLSENKPSSLSGVEVNTYNPNASLYDIREHFQGRNEAGRMNSKSDDETYMRLIQDLRSKLKTLAKKIEPKVYEYGFLKR